MTEEKPNRHYTKPKQQDSQLIEDEKNVAFIRGYSGNDLTRKVMNDIHALKKPFGVHLNKRNVVKPFEDISPIEFMCARNECSLFLFSSHSKKRPNNLTMGRLFNDRLLDMVEFGVDNYKAIQDLPARVSLGMKPILIFGGEPFETDFEHIRIKNLFNDFFLGPKPANVSVKGIEHVIMFVAANGKIYMRPYLIEQKKMAGRYAVKCHDMGPQIDFIVKRAKLANDEHFKEACKQKLKSKKPKRNKNISKDELGTTHGKIHIGRQDYGKMFNVKY